ncbi:MAG: Zn-dependent oligopeptidase [Betaproteobacteria bacterium]|nr:Zn-dependent oligopeptidase [Betaproteobacteria bacterium]
MRRLIPLLACCWLCLPALVQAAAERPLLPVLSAEQISGGCSTTIDALKQRIAALEKLPAAKARDPRLLFQQWNALQIAQEDFQGPVELLGEVSPDKAVRDAAEPCMVAFSKYNSELYQNEKLYAMFKAVKARDPIDRKLRQDLLWSFEDTGVSLPAEKRVRMKAILTRLEELSQAFSRNIRDNDQRLAFKPAEVQGLPPEYLAKAKRDAEGNYLLGFAYPEFIPFMEHADSSAARQRYLFAFNNRGTPKNLEILKEAIALRKEMAGLFGLPSFADFVIRRRMAQTPAAVNKFLGEVRTAVTAGEKAELEELRLFAAKAQGQTPDDTKLRRWDVQYWQQKLKRARYDLDPNALRKYFPAEAAVAWIMHVSGLQYGVEFRPAYVPNSVPVWHPEVRYYDVIDAQTRRRISGIYLDIHPRDGKFSHAAAFPVRGASTAARRTPISVLVANFNRDGFDDNEMKTLTHEFGHILHGVLSRTRYASQAGTNTERDFVEAPSQMYEEWARNLEPLALVANFCQSECPRVDAALVQKMTAAHNFGRAIRYARQLLYASFDMAIYADKPVDPLAAWNEMESATPLGYVKDTQFPGTFNHVMSGYGAGYYGYMWAEVLALDMLSAFNGKLLNPEVGARYRDTILSRGGEMHGMEMVRGFLGREPNSQAFFAEIAGKRLK